MKEISKERSAKRKMNRKILNAEKWFKKALA